LASAAIKTLSLLACAASPFPDRFTDHDLKAWLQFHPRGLIAVISEGMPYSSRNLPILKAEATRRKLPLLVLYDRCPTDSEKQDPCCSALASDSLISIGALRHFPSLFFNRNHRLLPKVVPGFQTRAELNENLDAVF
jgi:hypothetical protein